MQRRQLDGDVGNSGRMWREAEEAEDTINPLLGQVLGIEDESEALEGFGSFLKKASRS
jgi:hypothetical protein